MDQKNVLFGLIFFSVIFLTIFVQDARAQLSAGLVSPANGSSSTTGNVTFTCNASDDNNLVNITLYVWNSSSGIYYKNTTDVSGTSNETNWSVNDVPPGDYHWNCLAYNNSQAAWAQENYSLHANLFYLFESSAESDSTRAVAIGDLNNDGYLDYIAGNYQQPNRI